MTSVLDEVLTPTHLGGLEIVRAGTQAPNINMLIYGQYGTGKTLLAGSADGVPEMRKVLCLDIEGGTLTLRHKYPNVELLRVTDWDQLANIYNELRAGLHKDYNTLIIDSLTEAQAFNMDAILIKEMEEAADDPEKNRDEDIANMRQWQRNQKHMKKFIRWFRDLPVSVIFTALVKDDKDKQSGKVRTLPDLPGKLAGQVPAMFDEVFYLSVIKIRDEQTEQEEDKRVLLTGSTERIAAKDRSGRLPKTIVDPTMTDIYIKMIGETK